MSDFKTMSAESQAALREALTGTMSRAGLFKIKAHCGSCGGAIETTRTALAGGEPPVWETREGVVIFCQDHHPECPGCSSHPNRLIRVEAWLGPDSGDINGLVCPDCSNALRRRINDLVDEAEDAGFDLSGDHLPEFRSHGEQAHRLRDPIARLVAR